jgi:hypothetical protein
MFLSRTNQGAYKEAAPFERLLQYKGKFENYRLRVVASLGIHQGTAGDEAGYTYADPTGQGLYSAYSLPGSCFSHYNNLLKPTATFFSQFCIHLQGI